MKKLQSIFEKVKNEKIITETNEYAINLTLDILKNAVRTNQSISSNLVIFIGKKLIRLSFKQIQLVK